ncbi:neuropeptide S receptor isoform X2 [Aquarana catesbeiana]|uniref:neuropeptide S receptor isoform X2 n=1 Tax=Aquarana catesbeiana TaxID=8400 RepID=UPI003CC9B7B3
MQVSYTEASIDSNRSTEALDLIITTCTSTISATELTEENEWPSFYTSFKTEQLITLWILFFIIIIGNSVVLYLTTKERVRKRKSRMTFFVIQLAITDGLTGIISIMTDIIWRYTGNFMAPDIVCRVVRYLQVVLLYASTYVLVSLSIDRYHAIVHPMKFLQGEKQAKVLIVVAWTLSFLFSIPTLIIFRKIQLPNGETQCWAIWPDDSYWKPYMTTVALLIYFIPLIIISVIYFIVIRTIWAKSKSHSVIISNCTVYDGKLDDIPLQSTHNCTLLHEPPYIYSKNFRSPSTDGKFCASYNHRGLISKAKMKAIKYSIVVILAFILCWSPYFLFDILDNFEMLPKTQARNYASVIIQNLPVLNSAVNPIIYCIFSNRHCRLSRDRNSGKYQGTLRDKTEGVEMQIVSKPEYI